MIVHEYVAAVGSVLPAASVARTEKVWLPSAMLLSAYGEVQPAKPFPSRSHSKVDGVFVEVNAKLGDESLEGSFGCEVIVVSGAAVSTVQV